MVSLPHLLFFTITYAVLFTLLCTYLLFFQPGLAFWKCPRRKVFAVKLQDLTSNNGAIAKPPKKRITFADSDDDDDFEPLQTSSKKGAQKLRTSWISSLMS